MARGAARSAAGVRRSEVIGHYDLFPPNVIFRDGLADGVDRLGLRRARAAPLDSHRPRTSGCRSPRRPGRALGPRRPDRVASGCACSATGTGSTSVRPRELLDVVAIGTGWATSSTGEAASTGCPAGSEMWDAGQRRRDPRAERLVRGAPRRTATIPRMSLDPITVVVTASGAPGPLRSSAGSAKTASATFGSSAPTCPSAPSAGTSAMPSTSSRPARIPTSPPPSARRRGRGRRLRPAAVVVRSRGPGRASRHVPGPVLVSKPDAIFRSNDKAETYELLHRLGLPAPAFRRVNGAPRWRPRRASSAIPTCRCASSRCSPPVARLPDPRPDGRPGPPAPERAAGLGRDAPRGSGRAAPRRGRAPSPRDGARDRRERTIDGIADGERSCSAIRRRARRCAPGSRCTSSRSRTRR